MNYKQQIGKILMIPNQIKIKTVVKTMAFCLVTAMFFCSQVERVLAGNNKLYVDAAAVAGGDGSKHNPYRRITDAVNQARAIWQADTKSKAKFEIEVAPGTYIGSYTNTGPTIEVLPILIDFPNLKLRGGTSMLEDENDLPTGVFETGKNSLLVAQPALTGNQMLLKIAPPSVDKSKGIEVSNLSFDMGYTMTQTPAGGIAIEVERSQDFILNNNFVTGGFNYPTGGATAGIDIRASSGKISGNYITKSGCGACVSLGNASSPAQIVFTGNRSINNANYGLLMGGDITASGYDTLSAVVEENDLSDNNINANQGGGIRVIVVKHDPPDLATSGNVTVFISDNRISNNNFGYSIDAGFPYRVFNGSPDPRLHTGTVNLSLEDNEVVGNLRAPALITFNRNTATLNPGSSTNGVTRFKYLEHSTYNITDADGELNGYWFDHPVSDSVDGRTLQNTLRINGVVIPNGRYVPFP